MTSYYRIDYSSDTTTFINNLDLPGYQNMIIGRWIGYVTTPWTNPYNVEITFESSGNVSGKSLSASDYFPKQFLPCQPQTEFRNKPFYYDQTLRDFSIELINGSGKATGTIFNGALGSLRNISFSDNGNYLTFEYYKGDYGPILYRLIRI